MAKRVILSGCDGAGKTTVALLLASHLSRRVRVSVSWLRGSHLHVSLLYRLLSRLGTFRGPGNPYYGVSVPPRARRAFSLLEFTGFAPQLLARWLRGLSSSVLVCDRGALDFLTWVVATLEYPEFLRSLLGRFLLALSRREAPVVLTASLTALRRRADVPPDFLLRELACYNVLQRYAARCVVDTSTAKPVESAARVLRCAG